jgi:hypothetical protein
MLLYCFWFYLWSCDFIIRTVLIMLLYCFWFYLWSCDLDRASDALNTDTYQVNFERVLKVTYTVSTILYKEK